MQAALERVTAYAESQFSSAARLTPQSRCRYSQSFPWSKFLVRVVLSRSSTILVRAFRHWDGTGKRVQIPRCRATVSELFGARPLCKREGLRRCTRCPHRNSQARRPARTAASSNPFRVRRRVDPHSSVFVFLLAVLPRSLSLPISKSSCKALPASASPAYRSALYRAADNAGVGIQTTTGDGVVTFPNLADGQYQAVVLAPGFAEQSLHVTVPQTAIAHGRTEAGDHAADRRGLRPRRRPTLPSQTGTSVDLLNSDQLTLLNPVAASDALRYIPGAIVNTTGRRAARPACSCAAVSRTTTRC